MKRIVALVLAFVMVLGMSTVAYAYGGSGKRSGGSPVATSTVTATVKSTPNKNAVSGTWTQTATGWKFNGGGKTFVNTWGFVNNPYTNTADQGGWYFFDPNGVMLTGWQFINGKWYYLNATSNGDLGKCYINTITPDGYKVDETGAWIQ